MRDVHIARHDYAERFSAFGNGEEIAAGQRLRFERPTMMELNANTLLLGRDLAVRRVGCGAMRITGRGYWGEPDDRDAAKKILRRALELGLNFIDTADAYGPETSA